MPVFDHTGHWFGLKPEPAGISIVAAWGARAILAGRFGQQQQVDILPDRKQLWAPEGASQTKEVDAFRAFLRNTVGPWLDRCCGSKWIDPSKDTVFTLDQGRFHAVASPKASGGYLYVGAWMTAKPTEYEAYVDGWNKQRAGHTAQMNPYEAASPDHDISLAWAQGFHRAAYAPSHEAVSPERDGYHRTPETA